MAPADRRRTGAFFTPFSLVERVSTSALAAALGDDGARALAGEPLTAARARTLLEAVERLTVLDPACGSGAFLVHALERVASLRATLGDGRDLSTIRRDVLTRSIFGVDVNPTAVWLCELRLWLSVVIESEVDDPLAVTPLPNLDRNVRAGDALSGRAFGSPEIVRRDGKHLRGLRERYARATGRRKATCLRRLERAERAYAVAAIGDELRAVAAKRRDVLVARRGRDLFGDRYQPSRDERDTAAELRCDGPRRSARCDAESSAAARFRSASPLISPTSRPAADLESSSATRRGCALTGFRSRSEKRIDASTRLRGRRPGSPARAPRAPDADSRRRSTSRRCSSNVRSSFWLPAERCRFCSQ